MGTLIAYNEKNTLLPTEQAYSAYARYFARVLQAYRAEGLAIQYFTLQNEPLFGNSDQYPGMYFSNEQAVKLGTTSPAPVTVRRSVSEISLPRSVHSFLQETWSTVCWARR